MTSRISKWFSDHKKEELSITLEEVKPLHPDQYPAKHLKEILDDRRSDFEERASQPTGMLDGPGPLT